VGISSENGHDAKKPQADRMKIKGNFYIKSYKGSRAEKIGNSSSHVRGMPLAPGGKSPANRD